MAKDRAGTPEGESMRLQKFLSRAGIASRRASEGLMAQGRVKVNGRRVTSPGMSVTPGEDRVEVDGEVVSLEPFRWILLNKPPGTVTTASDPGGRPTVYSLLPEGARSLNYVGRLDMETEGLLILTNDGDALHGLLHPSSEIPREYRARVKGVPPPARLRSMEGGIQLEDGPARPESVRLLRTFPGDEAEISLVLREGRKREVRRIFEAIGHPVITLRRVAFGPQRLGDLPRGKWRELRPEEVRALREAASQ
jgi:23S rRNA pseudouridine2605 synthase